jgi:cytochrome c-type protein NapB
MVKQAHMPGAPPPIPHSPDMRGNCVACHAGPGAVAEIRTPHPERANCRQCHVPTEDSGTFDRGGVQ